MHYRHVPGVWKPGPHDDTIQTVQNRPIPVIYPAESQLGLWGGEGIVRGLGKKDEPRAPRSGSTTKHSIVYLHKAKKCWTSGVDVFLAQTHETILFFERAEVDHFKTGFMFSVMLISQKNYSITLPLGKVIHSYKCYIIEQLTTCSLWWTGQLLLKIVTELVELIGLLCIGFVKFGVMSVRSVSHYFTVLSGLRQTKA